MNDEVNGGPELGCAVSSEKSYGSFGWRHILFSRMEPLRKEKYKKKWKKKKERKVEEEEEEGG